MIVYCYSIFTLLSTCACDLHIPSKFHPSRIAPAFMTSYRFFKMAAMALQFVFLVHV